MSPMRNERIEMSETTSGNFARRAAVAARGARRSETVSQLRRLRPSFSQGFRLRATSNFFDYGPKVAIRRLPGLVRTVLCSTSIARGIVHAPGNSDIGTARARHARAGQQQSFRPGPGRRLHAVGLARAAPRAQGAVRSQAQPAGVRLG